jgi:hypothetical protein
VITDLVFLFVMRLAEVAADISVDPRQSMRPTFRFVRQILAVYSASAQYIQEEKV